MIERSQITIDTVLRSRLELQDLRFVSRLLAGEIPRPRVAALWLGLLTIGEVVSHLSVVLIAKVVLEKATSPDPVVDGHLLLAAAAISLVGSGLTGLRHEAQERFALACRERGVARLAANLSRASYEDLSSVPMAELREVLMTDVDFTYRFFIETLSQAAVITFWLIAAILLLAWVSPLLLGLLAIVGLAGAVVVGLGIGKHVEIAGERFSRIADLSQRARDLVEVERVVQARQLGISDLFVCLFMRAHAEFVRISLLQSRLSAALSTSVAMLNSLAFLAVLFVGGALIVRGSMTAGGLVAILFVLAHLFNAVAQLSGYAWKAAETSKAAKRIAAYWSAPASGRRRGSPHPEGREAVFRLSAREVSFHYGTGAPVLAGLDVDLDRGRLTCLTGATGSGKTTLSLLLTGILQPSQGRVFLNGDLDWSPAHLAPGRVLYIGSKAVLVEGSAWDNLLLSEGEPGPSDEDLARFLAPLARNGSPWPVHQPVVGPNGTGLSSGQAQLFQLARAVFRDPSLVVFDEATSALDMATEAKVQEALLDWCRRRICLVVSHRRCPWTEQAGHRLTLGA